MVVPACSWLRHPARRDRDHHPQHRPPAPRRQPTVGEQQDQEKHRREREDEHDPRQPPDHTGRGQRPRGHGQPPQRVLLRQHRGRQRQPDQAQQPTDGVAPNTAGDQAAGARIHDHRERGDAVYSDPARGHLARIQPEQYQRRRQDEHGEPGQRPGSHAYPVPTAMPHERNATPGPFRERYRSARNPRSRSRSPAGPGRPS